MSINRREFIGGLAAAGALSSIAPGSPNGSAIDRKALVSRHNPVLHTFEPLSPLSVGNGEFAFTCDITGLQTFPELYENAMPLCTMSQWGWHTTPVPEAIKGTTLELTDYDTYGRPVGYMTGKSGQEQLFDWLRENPHRLHLGQVGFRISRSDRGEAKPGDISDIEQKLDLWTGTINSNFKFEGIPVSVITSVHPTVDLLAVSVTSDLLLTNKLAVKIAFPYGSQSMHAADWTSPDAHSSDLVKNGNGAVIRRKLDADQYFVTLIWKGAADLTAKGPHTFELNSQRGTRLDFAVSFSPERTRSSLLDTAATFAANQNKWKRFWNDGAAIDLSGSTDKRAKELERRIVLSQYQTAIQCSGSMPPQETALTCNSWYGKFHLEMHWWHAAHFALWDRFPLLDRSLDWYNKILPSARERARQQGYAGARWPKMTSPDGRDSPSPIGPLLIWQQPHPIYYAELAYMTKPTSATLNRLQRVVEETAEFMASYAYFDQKQGRYVLGPPVIPAQENHPPRETWNPTYEVEYWRYGLKTAQAWRQRIGLGRDPKWDDVINRLSRPTVKDGIYMAHENCPQTFTERNKDHPSMLAALGVLRGELIDRETMRRTLHKVMKEWDWPDTWGWDYPMVAMTAARLGEPELAIDALLLDTPKNHYAVNGHNYQRPNLPLYLPGNGGLLFAVALMAGGWNGAPSRSAPGFPTNGKWAVRAEGFPANILRQI